MSLLKTAKNLATQNGRMTFAPVFAVQQRRRIYGMDGEHSGGDEDTLGHIWVDADGDEVEKAVHRRLDCREREGKPTDGYKKVHYLEIWEFVTACFTEQGCHDYIALDGHNLKSPRIYAYSSYRNTEWIAVRNLLLSLVGR